MRTHTARVEPPGMRVRTMQFVVERPCPTNHRVDRSKAARWLEANGPLIVWVEVPPSATYKNECNTPAWRVVPDSAAEAHRLVGVAFQPSNYYVCPCMGHLIE